MADSSGHSAAKPPQNDMLAAFLAKACTGREALFPGRKKSATVIRAAWSACGRVTFLSCRGCHWLDMAELKTVGSRFLRGTAAAVACGWMAAQLASAQSFALTLRWNEPGATDPLEGSWPTMNGQQYFVETSRDLAQWSLSPFMENWIAGGASE
jgi:hypothetical protein